MDWWRAYHGLPNDPKLAVTAAKCKVKRSEVLSVWVAILDYASQNLPRGSSRGFDNEQAAWMLDMDISTVAQIVSGLTERGLIDAGGMLTAWDKRQPKREDDSRERVQRFRQDRNAAKRDVTQGNAPEREERVEEIREEKKEKHTQERSSVVERPPQKANGVCVLPTSPKFTEFWARWPRQVGMDSAFAAWNSYVHAGDEPLVFACLERFLASGDAERGAIPMAGPTSGKSGWLADCARDGWKCQWPTRAPPTQRSLTPTEQAIAEAKQRAKRTN